MYLHALTYKRVFVSVHIFFEQFRSENEIGSRSNLKRVCTALSMPALVGGAQLLRVDAEAISKNEEFSDFDFDSQVQLSHFWRSTPV